MIVIVFYIFYFDFNKFIFKIFIVSNEISSMFSLYFLMLIVLSFLMGGYVILYY